MFINTRAVSRKIITDVKLFSGIYSILVQLLYVAFLGYTVFAGCGSLALNITLLSVSVLFEGFLIFTFSNPDFFTRSDTVRIKHAFHILSLLVRATSLGITVYGIHITLKEFNTASLLFTTFMLFGWISGVLIEFFRFIIERYTSLMTSALSKDTEPFVRIYRKFTFRGYEGREEKEADSAVDELAAEYKQELKDKRESQKALMEAEKIIKKEEKRAKNKKRIAAAKEKVKSLFKKNNE